MDLLRKLKRNVRLGRLLSAFAKVIGPHTWKTRQRSVYQIWQWGVGEDVARERARLRRHRKRRRGKARGKR